MQVYNPNNPVYKYKSVKTTIPNNNNDHVEQNKETQEKLKIPDSYGLYIQPPQYDPGVQKPITYLQYVAFTIDTNDRDYSKYPNPFSFVTNIFTEHFKNIKIFQIFYITLPQLNLLKMSLLNDANYTFMLNYIQNNNIVNNQSITNGGITYTICNYYNNEVNYIINGNISLVYSIDKNLNYYSYGFSSKYKLNANPYLRLVIPEVIYSPILATDGKQFTYFVRMSRARNNIAYASVRAPTKVFKEQTLLNFEKLTFNFYDSTNLPLTIDNLDQYADRIDDPTNMASKYNYIRHPLFYYHQINIGVRIGVIRNSLK
jgi:hypothetical protein